MQVVAGGQRTELVQQPTERLGGLVDRLARFVAFQRCREAAESLRRVGGAHIELAIAAVLGGVERHRRTVIESCAASRGGVYRFRTRATAAVAAARRRPPRVA